MRDVPPVATSVVVSGSVEPESREQLGPTPGLRIATAACGATLAASSLLLVRYFFSSNYPSSPDQHLLWNISERLSCTGMAFSTVAQFAGVPFGYVGLSIAFAALLTAIFPSSKLGRTTNAPRTAPYSGQRRHLLLCRLEGGSSVSPVAHLFSHVSRYLGVLFKFAGAFGALNGFERVRPEPKHLIAILAIILAAAYSVRLYGRERSEAEAAKTVLSYFALPMVQLPSTLAPDWVIRSTQRFEDAPIQVVEFGDLLCSDSRHFTRQLYRLAEEFKGNLNVVFQHFPLDTSCNTVVPKNRHPGACEASLIASYDPAQFKRLHDELLFNLPTSKNPAWRRELIKRYGLGAAITDQPTRLRLEQVIQTGAEYEKTAPEYPHGIRSTPTLIINRRMVIGSYQYEQIHAVFEALLHRQSQRKKFIENWLE